MNSIQDALITAGLATDKQRRKQRPFQSKKVGKCRRCGEPLYTLQNSNIAVCQNPSCVTNKPRKDQNGNETGASSFIVFDR